MVNLSNLPISPLTPESGVLTSLYGFCFHANLFYIFQVLIHVTDVNDNVPRFVQRVYKGNVSEASSVGSVVLDEKHQPLVIKATDNDTDLNSLLLYEISDHFAQDYFSIDPSTGAIRTIRNMDHET